VQGVPYLLPEGITCLVDDFSNISSVSSNASCEGLLKLSALMLGILKLSLDECTEFIILGLITMVVHAVLSFHHLKTFGHLFLQHLQQQQ
jgi:hypothetical protein